MQERTVFRVVEHGRGASPETSGLRHGAYDDGDGTLLPSQRIAVPPASGTEDAAFLENLNEIYGVEDPADTQMIEGIRQHLRVVLEKAP